MRRCQTLVHPAAQAWVDVVDAILGGALENGEQEEDGSVPEPEFQSALNVANSLGVSTLRAGSNYHSLGVSMLGAGGIAHSLGVSTLARRQRCP